jgi:hypothetical protein
MPSKRYINKDHVEWVTTLECCLKNHFSRLVIAGIAPTNIPECSTSSVQAHHLLKPFYSARGMGLKASDKDVIPLCQKHHRELHLIGDEYKFFENLVFNSRFAILTVQKIWEISPYNQEKDND